MRHRHTSQYTARAVVHLASPAGTEPAVIASLPPWIDRLSPVSRTTGIAGPSNAAARGQRDLSISHPKRVSGRRNGQR